MIYEEYTQALYEKLLIKLIADRRQEILEKLANSDGIKDFPSYAKWVGYVKALKDVMEIMATTKEQIKKSQ